MNNHIYFFTFHTLRESFHVWSTSHMYYTGFYYSHDYFSPFYLYSIELKTRSVHFVLFKTFCFILFIFMQFHGTTCRNAVSRFSRSNIIHIIRAEKHLITWCAKYIYTYIFLYFILYFFLNRVSFSSSSYLCNCLFLP